MAGPTWAIVAFKEAGHPIIYSVTTHGGYIDHAGMMLNLHFDSPTKAKHVASLGKILLIMGSLLEKSVGTPIEVPNAEALFEAAARDGVPHVYFYDEKWYYAKTSDATLVPVKDLLVE
jgi:hypothetical protein